MVATVTLNAATGPAQPDPEADGIDINVTAGDSGADLGEGGAVNIRGGDSLTDGAGGGINITGGAGQTGPENEDGAGGGIRIAGGAGQGNEGYGGRIELFAGSAESASNADGGGVDIDSGNAGSGGSGHGGDIAIQPGGGGGVGGRGGNLFILMPSAVGDAGQVIIQLGVSNGAGAPGQIAVTGNGILDFANDAAAEAGGIQVGGIYRTASALKIRVA